MGIYIPNYAYCLIVNLDLFFRLFLSKLYKYIEIIETFKFGKIGKIVRAAHGPQAQSFITQRKSLKKEVCSEIKVLLPLTRKVGTRLGENYTHKNGQVTVL